MEEGQEVEARQLVGGQRQPPGAQLADVLEGGQRLLPKVQQPLGMHRQDAAGVGQQAAPARPVEERPADLILEPLDGLADGRLRAVERLGRGREAALPDDGQEGFQLGEFHGNTISLPRCSHRHYYFDLFLGNFHTRFMKERARRIFDTTLRDGEQAPGFSMTPAEKVRMAEQLEQLGVDIIEAGFPISSDGDFEAVRAVAATVRTPVVAGLARAVAGDIDRAWAALAEARRPRIHVFLATSDLHLQHKLRIDRATCLARTREAVRRARGYTPDVEFSAEDATRSDLAFLCEVVEVAVEAGATTINLPDTVGYALPADITRMFTMVGERVGDAITLSAHCHNDLGLAVANSIAAVQAGARQVECTVNGIGERAGNAALEEFVMALHVRPDDLPYETGIVTPRLVPASQTLAATVGIGVAPNKAIVGANAFAHEAGIHQDGMLKHALTYEIMRPESVGPPAPGLSSASTRACAGSRRGAGPSGMGSTARSSAGLPSRDRAGGSQQDGGRRAARSDRDRRNPAPGAERGASPRARHRDPGGGMALNIVLLPGDGIGPEVVAEAARLLARVGELYHVPMTMATHAIGGDAIERAGTPLPPATLDACLAADAVLLGAVGHPRYEDRQPAGGRRPDCWRCVGRWAVRQLRPAICLGPWRVQTAFRPERVQGADLLIVRKCWVASTSASRAAIAAGRGLQHPHLHAARSRAGGARRLRARPRPPASSGLGRQGQRPRDLAPVEDGGHRGGAELSDVALEHVFIDTCAMRLSTTPADFDVILADNLFGDILSDRGGGRGSACCHRRRSAGSTCTSRCTDRRPTSPGAAGEPIGAIASAAMLLRYTASAPRGPRQSTGRSRRPLAAGARTRDIAALASACWARAKWPTPSSTPSSSCTITIIRITRSESMRLSGADILWSCLVEHGVDTVFGYPGGPSCRPDRLPEHPIRHVLVRHEQSATHMADGYARASGRVGVALATSGLGPPTW